MRIAAAGWADGGRPVGVARSEIWCGGDRGEDVVVVKGVFVKVGFFSAVVLVKDGFCVRRIQRSLLSGFVNFLKISTTTF